MTTASAQERIEHGLPLQGSALGRGAPDIHCGISVGHDQIVLDGTSLESRTVAALARQASARIRLSERCRAMVQTSRAWLDDRVQDGEAIYGATTGVGGFAGWLLSPEQAAGLQRNLIAAVASNMGPYLPNDAVRAAMLARINVLARGHSAIRLETLDHLVEMFNRGVIPRIPSLGSLGASGDLGPLACIALVAAGRWCAVVRGQEKSGGEALACVNLKPLDLSYKEGLSLINGTSAMTGLGALNVADARQLLASYHRVSVLTLEALRAKIKPFTPSLHELKNHPGQIRSAGRIFGHLSGSHLVVADDLLSERLKGERSLEASQGSDPIEDSYVLRCTPQILGPVVDTLDFVAATIDRELNATSDNPVILPSSGEIFHNGHFHGQYVSATMDYLCIALTTLSNLAIVALIGY